jgi:hypothetical protein
MELQEIKNTWAEYDKKLSESLKVNEELLKRMNLDKSKKELNSPMYGEMAAVVVMFLVFLPMMFYTIYMIKQPVFSILSFISAAIAFICMIFAILKTKAFLKIDYYNTPIVQLQNEITSLKMFILKFRKIEFVLATLLIICMAPVLFRWIWGIDIFASGYFIDPIIRIALALAIAIPLSIWMNKHFYDKKIENAQYHLKEIEKFSKEEESLDI